MTTHRQTLGWRSWAIVVLVTVVVALVPAAHVPAATPAAVDIKDFQFSPPSLNVPVGTTVIWTNHDEESHTITSTAGAFSSTGLSQGDTFAQTFSRPGTYQYFCALHPHMRATVTVK